MSGHYLLSFHNISGAEVSILPVKDGELVLNAQVTDASGFAAQSGSVIFEYCSYNRLPPHGITRADEAPKEACDGGTAAWARLLTVKVNESGMAAMNFGVVQIPRTVGFRFRYLEQKSGIASGTSAELNFTWISAA